MPEPGKSKFKYQKARVLRASYSHLIGKEIWIKIAKPGGEEVWDRDRINFYGYAKGAYIVGGLRDKFGDTLGIPHENVETLAYDESCFSVEEPPIVSYKMWSNPKWKGA